jgi:hypothetical protein
MIRTISKPKPAVDPAVAKTQLIVPLPKKKPVNMMAHRPDKVPARADIPGKVAFRPDVMGGGSAGRQVAPAPAKPATDGKRRVSFGKRPATASQPAGKAATQSRPRPPDKGMGLAPYVIGLIVLVILLIIGIVSLNNVNNAPKQTWVGETIPEAAPAEHARPMKEYMEAHGGGSQALKDRKNRVRGDGRQGATFVHNTKTGETKDLNDAGSAPAE